VNRTPSILLAICLSLGLSGCAQEGGFVTADAPQAPDVADIEAPYDGYAIPETSPACTQTQDENVLAGMVIGGIAGGVIGHEIPDKKEDKAAGTAIGATLGAMLGALLASSASENDQSCEPKSVLSPELNKEAMVLNS
jgi:outer membrane lipoprotein SlyB